MARRDDLAGLAALGALGYALTRGGKSADEAPRRQFASDATPVATPAAPAVNRMLYPDESSNTIGQYAPAAPAAAPMRQAPVRTTAPVRAAAPVVGPQGRSYSAADMAAMQAYDQARKQQMMNDPSLRPGTPESQAIERVYPEAQIQGFGLKGLANLAKNLAARGSLREYSQPLLQGSSRELLGAPPKQLTGPTKAELVARDRAARAAAREAEKEQFNRRGVDRFYESTFEGGMKKGGKAKAKPKKMASGGVARSSASKRADGIASKGKTKGRMI